MPTNLIVAVPGELGDYCFQSWQRLNVDILSRAKFQFRTDVPTQFWNVKAATPTVDDRLFPWLNLNDGRVYQWSWTHSLWISPMEAAGRESTFRKMWAPPAGTVESELWSKDGGDGTNPSTSPPTIISGAAWEVDHNFDGRFPLASGTLPGVTPATTADVGNTGGEAQHSLALTEMPPHVHHFTATANNASSSGTGELTGGAYDSPNDGHFTGDTENAGGVSDLGTPPTYTVAAHNNIPQYLVIFWIKPTVKMFYTVPG